MGRRHAGELPAMRQDKRTGHARVRINGKTYWLGRWGSPEARDKFDTLMAAFIASGRSSVDAALAVAAPPPCPVPALAAGQDGTGGLTVGELARAWLDDIERTQPNHRRTSLWHGAIAASRAVRPFATMPAASFGSRALVEVQRHLVNHKVPARGKAADGGELPAVRLSRRYINDIVGRVRQMFHWGVLQELVPDDRVKALEIVPTIQRGQTKARETKRRKRVRPSVVRDTLPFLTPEVADLIRFMRLTGCRPSEAARMKLRHIRDRDRPVWRYVPHKHKTARHGKQRHIAIGPRAQGIILAHTAGRTDNDYVFTPQRSVPPRQVRDGVIAIAPTKPSPRVGRKFTKDAIRQAVARAVVKANRTRTAAGLPPLRPWTPYQLRYTRTKEARNRYGRETARAIAGHSRATMTDHYAPENWRKAARFAERHG